MLHSFVSPLLLLSCSFPSLFFLPISSVYNTSDPWIIPEVNCVWRLQLHPPSSSCSIFISPPSLSSLFFHFTFNYQTAITRHVEGRIKHVPPGKHTQDLARCERGFIHLCMPHLSVPIVCIPWENVCRWTGGGGGRSGSSVGEFHRTSTCTCTHHKREWLWSWCFAEVGVFLLHRET